MNRPPAISLRAAVWLAAALICCSCTSRSLQGVLVPTAETAEGVSRVPILIATTRARAADDAGAMFGGMSSDEMSFGQVTVSIPPDNARAVGEVQWPAAPPGDPRREFVTVSSGYLDRAGFARAVADTAKVNRRSKAMVFVHGFNNRFDDAVYRFAQIVRDGRLPVVPILFSWPSRGIGSLNAYQADREVATQSGGSLQELLDAVASVPGIQEITLVCHSMGCLVMLDALHAVAQRGGKTAAKLKNVALVAPDVEADVFLKQIGEMGPRRPRFALFVSQDDTALKLSGSLPGNTARLGDISPEQEPYKSELAQQKILVFDLTHLGGDDPHSRAFDQVGTVMGLLERRLAQGQPFAVSHATAASAR
jgi:esterase/lipase superfamily enzyme